MSFTRAAVFAFRLTRVVATAGLLACVTTPKAGVHTATPMDAAIGAGMAADEIARSKGEEVIVGWKLTVIGDRARLFQCTSENTCGERPLDLPASSVVAVKVVGRVRPVRDDGSLASETDVLRVTVARGVTTSRGGVAIDPNRGVSVGGAEK
jgi:hypothetical protein